MTQTSPPSPFPLSPCPSLPSRGVWGQCPQWWGSGGYPGKKIEIGFGAFWRIFVSKRQLNINRSVQKKGLINYVWPIYLGEFFPLQGVILFPLSPIWTQVASTSPCIDAPGYQDCPGSAVSYGTQCSMKYLMHWERAYCEHVINFHDVVIDWQDSFFNRSK